MKPLPTKRIVDALARDLLAPILEAGSPRGSWDVLSWDAEQGLCLTLSRGEHTLLVELEDRQDLRPCYDRTRLFNVCARRLFEGDTPMSGRDRRLVDLVVEVVRRRESRLPVIARPQIGRSGLVREILVDRVLVPEGRSHYYINPYVGCTIGCEFCYVAERADLSRRLEGLPELRWGHWVDVKVNAPEVLRRELGQHPPGVVRMSPILTDPYQPLERRHRITRQCLEVLLEGGFVPVILTRAARVVEDLDLLRRFPVASVGLSIPTDDDRCRRIFEPGADPVEERLEALRQCRAAGLHTTAVIQPMLPMDVEALLDTVAPLVDVVRVDRMYVIDQVRHRYQEHELAWAATDAFFERTGRELVEGFRARGVEVDEMEDLVRMLGISPERRHRTTRNDR